MPLDFGVSARLGTGRHFVIEADEYDTAFFDKRAKFVHYRPRTAILNNLEHDHADIYPDVASIQRQFHLLLRTVPGNGRLIVNADEPNLQQALEMGCWTPIERFSAADASGPVDWRIAATSAGDFAAFDVWHGERCIGRVDWDVPGRHNAANALAALAAAHHAGVPVEAAIEALRRFRGVKRRLEVRGVVGGITVYDDFAHHPTAITTTLDGVRQRAAQGRTRNRRAGAALEHDETRHPQDGAGAFADGRRSRLRLPVTGGERGTSPMQWRRSAHWRRCKATCPCSWRRSWPRRGRVITSCS